MDREFIAKLWLRAYASFPNIPNLKTRSYPLQDLLLSFRGDASFLVIAMGCRRQLATDQAARNILLQIGKFATGCQLLLPPSHA